MVKVIGFQIMEEYKILIEFNDGIKGMVDFKNIFEKDHRKIIRDLLNKELFNTAKINLHTICWDNEVDFAPDYLYEQVKMNKDTA
jgi:hypothetical protein